MFPSSEMIIIGLNRQPPLPAAALRHLAVDSCLLFLQLPKVTLQYVSSDGKACIFVSAVLANHLLCCCLSCESCLFYLLFWLYVLGVKKWFFFFLFRCFSISILVRWFVFGRGCLGDVLHYFCIEFCHKAVPLISSSFSPHCLSGTLFLPALLSHLSVDFFVVQWLSL